jgi:hypothetical protein
MFSPSEYIIPKGGRYPLIKKFLTFDHQHLLKKEGGAKKFIGMG